MDLTHMLLVWPQSEGSGNLRSDHVDRHPLCYSQAQEEMPQLMSIPSVAGSAEAESCYQRGVSICRIYTSLCEYESRVEKHYELVSQSCFSAPCIVAARCWWYPLLPAPVGCMECVLLS